MTREEALEVLNGILNLNYREWWDNKCDEAIDMAIKALKTEPIGTDLISRADAMAEFREWVKRANENGETPTWNDAVSLIGSLPSAEAVDVYKAHEEEHFNIINRIKELQYAIAKTQTIVGKLVESADAVPTVIRAKTFMRKEDFDKWADGIKKQNKNIVCIPCDAEVVSAESVVRCKDCKYSFYDKDYESYNCRKHEYVECFDADDYCSWGERND